MIEHFSKGVWRLELSSHTLAPFSHTNSYLIAGYKHAAIIDPGFHDEASLDNVTSLLESESLTLDSIFLSHSHPDHCNGLPLLKKAYPNAKVYLHPKENIETSNLQNLPKQRKIGEHIIHVIFTPGHSPGHVCFYLKNQGIAFVGDLVAGQGSTWIGVPEGNVQDYLESLQRIFKLELLYLAPGHGQLIHEPYKKLQEVFHHRVNRLEQVYQALENKPLDLNALRKVVYPKIAFDMIKLANYSLMALLDYLITHQYVKRDTQAQHYTRGAKSFAKEPLLAQLVLPESFPPESP